MAERSSNRCGEEGSPVVATPDTLDQRAMERLRDGDASALDELMDRHATRLARFLFRDLQDEQEALDLAQEAFARVFQHRLRFKAGHKFSTWLYAIAVNLSRDRRRWQRRHPQVSMEAVWDAGAGPLRDRLVAPSADPSEVLVQGESVRAVRAAIAALPEDLRTPLLLAEYEELSYEEMAGVLKCSRKAVEMRLYRARRLLREALVSAFRQE